MVVADIAIAGSFYQAAGGQYGTIDTTTKCFVDKYEANHVGDSPSPHGDDPSSPLRLRS